MMEGACRKEADDRADHASRAAKRYRHANLVRGCCALLSQDLHSEDVGKLFIGLRHACLSAVPSTRQQATWEGLISLSFELTREPNLTAQGV